MIKRHFYIEIDKLTRSIENAISGDSFKTEIILLTSKESKEVIGFLIGKQKLRIKKKMFTSLRL